MKLFTLIRDSFRQESAVITWAQMCMKGGGGGIMEKNNYFVKHIQSNN